MIEEGRRKERLKQNNNNKKREERDRELEARRRWTKQQRMRAKH